MLNLPKLRRVIKQEIIVILLSWLIIFRLHLLFKGYSHFMFNSCDFSKRSIEGAGSGMVYWFSSLPATPRVSVSNPAQGHFCRCYS